MGKCNAVGIALIKEFESCRLSSYPDPGGVWTIGWGHTGREVGPGMTWTQAKADAQFLEDLVERAEKPVAHLVRYELDENQFSALVSFVYNIGSGNFAKSAVLKALNAGDLDDASVHMRAWIHDHAGKILDGLVRRREAEIVLYETLPADDENTV